QRAASKLPDEWPGRVMSGPGPRRLRVPRGVRSRCGPAAAHRAQSSCVVLLKSLSRATRASAGCAERFRADGEDALEIRSDSRSASQVRQPEKNPTLGRLFARVFFYVFFSGLAALIRNGKSPACRGLPLRLGGIRQAARVTVSRASPRCSDWRINALPEQQ
ncbi:hypothetical protein, partial [Paraburkholderia sp. Ac-20347]|uniref:hypothetical protein n=1 Tax=Paraburkholderia sp. Ac-20347 TaxID=2703892 RepID=UPI00197FFE53